jgi:hypothetical protein
MDNDESATLMASVYWNAPITHDDLPAFYAQWRLERIFINLTSCDCSTSTCGPISPNDNNDSNGPLPQWAIIAIAIGGGLVFLLIIMKCLCCHKSSSINDVDTKSPLLNTSSTAVHAQQHHGAVSRV